MFVRGGGPPGLPESRMDDAQHDFIDRAIRELLSRPDNLREFLTAVVPDLATGFERFHGLLTHGRSPVPLNVRLPGPVLGFADVFRHIDPLHETGRVRWRELLGFVVGWVLNKRPKTERPHWDGLAQQMQTTAERR
jgi:hypothetical protein